MALVRELPDDELSTPVPACPGWSVRDVVAHLTANFEDMSVESVSRPPTDEETAAQIARMRGRSVPQMLADWQIAAVPFEEKASASRMRMPLIDLTTHEHDIRGALCRPADRDSDAVRICSQFLLENMRSPVPMRVVVEDAEFRVGPRAQAAGVEARAAELVLTTNRFEALRWRMGRRSRAQLAAMRWSGDPAPVLGQLMVFGPATADVIE